jgi:hypothetical protein
LNLGVVNGRAADGDCNSPGRTNGCALLAVGFTGIGLTGTCIDLFSGCDDGEDFLFTNAFDSFDAAIALMDQVLLGIFDTQPVLANGCRSVELCGILTPNGVFGFVEFTTASSVVA